MSDERRHNREAGNNRPLAELLSVYLDDRESLTSDEIAQIERALAEDPEARQIYAQLEVIRLGLRDLEPIEAPHAFHLTAEMVGAPEPVPLHRASRREAEPAPAWYARHIDTVRWATAAAAVLFVFVLGADLVLNGVFSNPADSGETAQEEQAGVMSLQSDDDDAVAESGDAEMEAVEEAARDDSGGGDGAAAIPNPEAAADMSDAADDAGGTNEESSAPPAIASIPQDEEEAEALDGAVETMPAMADESARSTEGDAALDSQTLTYDDSAALSGDGDSDRRLWRIVEFSLVVLLGLLITATIVLPRMGRSAARTANK